MDRTSTHRIDQLLPSAIVGLLDENDGYAIFVQRKNARSEKHTLTVTLTELPID